MNRVDYELEIIGEKETYKPRLEFIEPIINSKNKIFEITADNSYGKTFLLNLLAYGLEADKLNDDRILRSIKEKISRYDDESSYKLEYNIDLDLPDNKKLSLSKEKGKGKIIKIDGSSPLSHTFLHKDLSVIYDVPTNPSERLNAVIKDLGTWNKNLRVKFEGVARHFHNVSLEFDNVRNEEKIKKLKDKVGQLKKDLKAAEKKIGSKKELISELKKLEKLNELIRLQKENLRLESEIVGKTKEFRRHRRPARVEKKDEKIVKQLNTELATTESNFKGIIAGLIAQIKSDNEINDLITEDSTLTNHYKRIKDTELREIFSSDEYVDIQNKFIYSIDHLKDSILRFIMNKKNDKSYVIHNSYSHFITLLEELMDNEIDYLLKNATSLDSHKLKKQLEILVSEHKVKSYDSVKRFLNSELEPLKGLMVQFMRTQRELEKENKKKLVKDEDNNYYRIEAELNKLKETSRATKNDLERTRNNVAVKMNIENLSRLTTIENITDLIHIVKKKISDTDILANITGSISELDTEIRALELNILDIKSEIRVAERLFIMEDGKNPSEYDNNQKQRIKDFIIILKRIIKNLFEYDKLIAKIESGDLSEFTDKEDINFMELSGKIIAYSMDNKLLRADGEFAELKFYDMQKQEFHCQNELIIKKDDVSTGLASANYLKQRIDNVDGKYVVVLLDEIGNMAQNALDTVVDSIKKLEQQNRLVLALFTRPNSKGIEIIEY